MRTIQSSKNLLRVFSRKTLRSAPEEIADKDLEIREAFASAGAPVKENSPLDHEIRNAVCRAHSISEKDKFKELACLSVSGRVDYRYIETLDDEIRQHSNGRGHKVVWGSIYELALHKLVHEAHKTCGENLLTAFCEERNSYDSCIISHNIRQVCRHFEAIGQPIVEGTKEYTKVWDAVCNMCTYSNLNPREMQEVFTAVENVFSEFAQQRKARDIIEASGKAEIETPVDYKNYQTRKAEAEQATRAAAEAEVAQLKETYARPYRPGKSYKWTRVAQRNERLIAWREKERRNIKGHNL